MSPHPEDNSALLSAADEIRAYERDKSAEEIATLSGQVATALAAAQSATRERDAALASVEDLQGRLEVAQAKQCQDPSAHEATEPVVGTAFGACPSGTSNASAAVSKWGQGVSIRGFNDGGFGSAWVRPAGAGSRCHVSWKASRTTALTKSVVVPALAQLMAGDVVEVLHEIAVKFRDGRYSAQDVDDALRRHEEFYAIVKAERPDLLVAKTDSAWMFQSNSGLFEDTTRRGAQFYKNVSADLVGVDFDGVSNLDRYPPFTGAIANIQKFVKDNGYKGWTVPEFVHPRLDGRNGEAVLDPDGTKRAAWAKTWAENFRAGGAYAVHLFDTNASAVGGRTGQPFETGSPEFAVWRPLIAS